MSAHEPRGLRRKHSGRAAKTATCCLVTRGCPCWLNLETLAAAFMVHTRSTGVLQWNHASDFPNRDLRADHNHSSRSREGVGGSTDACAGVTYHSNIHCSLHWGYGQPCWAKSGRTMILEAFALWDHEGCAEVLCESI